MPAHSAIASPRTSPYYASQHRHNHAASGSLLPVHPDDASLGRGPATPSYIDTPMPPLVISYRGTQLVHHQGWAPCHTSLPRHDYIASGRFLQEHLSGAFPGRGSRHACLSLHAHIASGRVLPAHLVDTSLGSCLCHASLHRYAYTASSRLLPAYPVGASPVRAPCKDSPQTLPLAISFWRAQLVHLLEGALPRLPTSACLRRLRSPAAGRLLPAH